MPTDSRGDRRSGALRACAQRSTASAPAANSRGLGVCCAPRSPARFTRGEAGDPLRSAVAPATTLPSPLARALRALAFHARPLRVPWFAGGNPCNISLRLLRRLQSARPRPFPLPHRGGPPAPPPPPPPGPPPPPPPPA